MCFDAAISTDDVGIGIPPASTVLAILQSTSPPLPLQSKPLRTITAPLVAPQKIAYRYTAKISAKVIELVPEVTDPALGLPNPVSECRTCGAKDVKGCEGVKRNLVLMCELMHVFALILEYHKVWLDKSTGKICLSMASNGLAITGIDDRRYWSRIPTEESRFGSVAYLQQIWWFEVNGEVAFPFPVGSYSVYFRLHLGRAARRFCRRVCSSEHVHGWDIKPVRFQLSTSDGQQATTQCYLNEPGKWIYHHSGDFIVTDSSSPMKLSFSMTQIDCTHTKGGLCVDSVLVRPMKPKRG
nr:F-box protein PP2-A12-like [Ipomoea batatas]